MITDLLGRLTLVSSQSLGWATKHTATFDYLNTRRQTARGACKILVPPGSGPFPLYFQCAYEIRDEVIRPLVDLGCMVVNPVAPAGTWSSEQAPSRRSINLDVALLHIARSLDGVDDTKVTLAGGSAGGITTWMLTAETFPLAGSMPDSAQLNTGYNAWYLARSQGLQEHATPRPMVAVDRLYRMSASSIGRHDCRADVWLQHSPVAHAEAITSPVHALHATADLMHPVDQVSRSLRRAPVDLPEAYSTCDDRPWTFLEDVFTDLHIAPVPVPAGTPVQEMDDAVMDRWLLGTRTKPGPGPLTPVPETPVAGRRRTVIHLPDPRAQVVVCVVEDGGPGPLVSHYRHAATYSRGQFLLRVLSTPTDIASQDTPGKRRVLAARAAGTEWIRSRLSHLDFPEAEQADVARARAHLS